MLTVTIRHMLSLTIGRRATVTNSHHMIAVTIDLYSFLNVEILSKK